MRNEREPPAKPRSNASIGNPQGRFGRHSFLTTLSSLIAELQRRNPAVYHELRAGDE